MSLFWAGAILLDMFGVASAPGDAKTLISQIRDNWAYVVALIGCAAILFWVFTARSPFAAFVMLFVAGRAERELKSIQFSAGDRWKATGLDVFAAYGPWLQVDKKADAWTSSVATYVVKQSERECAALGFTGLRVEPYKAIAQARAVIDCLRKNELLESSSSSNVEPPFLTYHLIPEGERLLGRAKKRARIRLSISP